MTVVPNLLDQDQKAFPFLRGEFPSVTSITIMVTSNGSTRCHAVVLPPRYKRATRTLMPHIRGTVPAIVGLHALHDTLNGACAEVVAAGRCQAAHTHDRFLFAVVDATTNYLHVLFNPLEQCRFL